ncbi:MAG: hypothetical protein O3A37_14915 [Planctomycetota bacterium]|nr:hypothetical protein [Planctomycetota bacterium]MDA1041562.1 hypothetical protein [Planctomycetota bacterium]
MGYFDGLGDFNNSFGAQPTSSNTTNGNSAKWQTGDSYSEQNGNANSRQFGNKNSFQRGWSNSLLEGVSFSTNLAATFSQLVGVGFSTQTAGSVTAFLGPKISISGSLELIVSKAAKYTWVKGEKELNVKRTEMEAAEKKEKFVKENNEWLLTKNLVAKDEIKKVLDGDMKYATLTTKVAGQCNTTAAAVTFKGAGQFTMSTMGKMALEGAAGITMEALKVQINGAIVNLG